MPRARSQKFDDWQTAAADNDAGGCLSFYALPPLAVILIACLLAALASNIPIQTSASPIVQPVSPSSSGLSPIFTREVQYWGNNIVRWANASSLDPNLVATVMQIESCGDPNALSRSGAMGLFQVMPFHFAVGENMTDVQTNAMRGLTYLSQGLQKADGNAGLALAGYNGGHGVISWGWARWPDQTRRYFYWGTGIYEDATNGKDTSARLQEWLQAGGSSLCQRAAATQQTLHAS